ncbi:MAG: DegT/DnrJ/EryC1/StrS family aminotransferase [Acidimicrobiales bacterium]
MADALRRFRNHGIERLPEVDPWYYEVRSLGFNYRLTDLQAALGASQLAKLDGLIERRNQIAQRYREGLADLPLLLPPAAPDGWRHGYHLFAVRVPERRRVFDGLHAAGIRVQVHYVPIHHHPVYADLGFRPEDLPHAEEAYAGLISLPMFPTLGDADVDRVVDGLGGLLA